jgi:hypothetical protein
MEKAGIRYILFRQITGSNKIDLTFNWCNHATVGSLEVLCIFTHRLELKVVVNEN